MFQVVVVVSNPFQKQTQRIKHRIFLQNLRFMQIYLTPPIQKLPGHSFFTSFAFHPKPFLEKRPPSTGARSPATAHLYAGKNYVAENPIPIYKTITMNTTVTTNLQLLQLLEQYLKKSSLLGHVRAVSSFHIFLHVVFWEREVRVFAYNICTNAAVCFHVWTSSNLHSFKQFLSSHTFIFQLSFFDKYLVKNMQCFPKQPSFTLEYMYIIYLNNSIILYISSGPGWGFPILSMSLHRSNNRFFLLNKRSAKTGFWSLKWSWRVQAASLRGWRAHYPC